MARITAIIKTGCTICHKPHVELVIMAESGRRSTRARRAPKTRNQQETVRKTAGRKSKKAALTEPKEGEHSLKHILAGQDLVALLSSETAWTALNPEQQARVRSLFPAEALTADGRPNVRRHMDLQREVRLAGEDIVAGRRDPTWLQMAKDAGRERMLSGEMEGKEEEEAIEAKNGEKGGKNGQKKGGKKVGKKADGTALATVGEEDEVAAATKKP